MLQTANASRRHYRAHTRSARVRDRPARESGANFIRRYIKSQAICLASNYSPQGGGFQNFRQKIPQISQESTKQLQKSCKKGDNNNDAQNQHNTTRKLHSTKHKGKTEYRYYTAKIINLFLLR